MNTQSEKPSALIIDDDPDMLEIVTAIIEDQGFAIEQVASVAEAHNYLKNPKYDLLVTDLHLPDGDGLEIIEQARKVNAKMAIVVLTGYPDESRVHDMMTYEISTFLVKPFTSQQLKYAVIRALEERKMRMAAEKVEQRSLFSEDSFGLVGASGYMENLRTSISIMAEGDFPVLISGPSGTGKEIIANAIHKRSNRSGERIVIINCAAIPHHLEESEFFGYAKGAFTDARTAKHGILECADKSTLFLDEIGELSLSVQAKLLRVLDTGEYIRIGEVHPKKVDIRIVSATNRNLEQMVEAGVFRADLYFRLKGAMITTESLEAHREDIAALCRHFIAMYDNNKHLTQGALERLQKHQWSGNIRELKNTIHYLVVRSGSHRRITTDMVNNTIGSDHVPPPDRQPFSKVKEEFERGYFIALLRTYNGNISRVAREAGIHRPNLIRKLKELGIHPDLYRSTIAKSVSAQP